MNAGRRIANEGEATGWIQNSSAAQQHHSTLPMPTTLYRPPGHVGPSQRCDQVVQVCAPHAGRVAEVRAVAARAPVPPVWAVRAVAEMPAPARAGEVVEGEQADVRELAGGEDRVEGVVAGVDVEVLGGLGGWVGGRVEGSERGERVLWRPGWAGGGVKALCVCACVCVWAWDVCVWVEGARGWQEHYAPHHNSIAGHRLESSVLARLDLGNSNWLVGRPGRSTARRRTCRASPIRRCGSLACGNRKRQR